MWWKDYILRIRALLFRRRMDEELQEELQFHIEMQARKNQRHEPDTAQATRQARLQFGSVVRATEECHEQRGISSIEILAKDLCFAGRMLRKNLSFTIIAVLTLALGIGANTAVFSMVNALLFHPYNFRDLDRIVLVWQDQGTDASFDQRNIAPGDAADIASHANIFQALATSDCHMLTVGSAYEELPADACSVSANFFDLLGVSPMAGRSFLASEEQPGQDAVAVVSYAFWQRQFGGDPSTVGKTIRINGRTYTVVGIMPADVNYPIGVQMWIPLALTPAKRADRSRLSFSAIARLKPGISVAQARTALARFNAELTREYPKTNAGRRTTLLPLRRELYQFTLPLFSLLQVAAGFVLLLACANLANLLFARMIRRQREVALRAALGAGRRRLVQLFLSETILFSVVAGAVAGVVSLWTVRLLRTSIPTEWRQWVPGWSGIQVDGSVLAFTILLATAIGVVFGLATLAYSRRADLNYTLKEGGPGSMSPARGRVRSALVVVQVIFALVLLVSAGLTIQGFMRLANIYEGFQPETVMEIGPVLHADSYKTSARIANFYRQLLGRTAALPEVMAAGVVGNPPASNSNDDTSTFEIEGRPARPGEELSAGLQIISPGYFRTLRVPMISGRGFSETDDVSSEPVTIVSRSMAEKFWPHENAVGQHLRLLDVNSGVDPPVDWRSNPGSWLTVVGVVDDIRQNWWNSSSDPVMYRPLMQAPERGLALVFRVTANPTAYVSSVRSIIRRLDPTVVLGDTQTLQKNVNDSIGIIRIMGILMGTFGAIALALSALGVYGVLSENVARRTREIGIRLALGATPRAVRRLVVGQAMKLTAVGLIIAVPTALLINRAMASFVLGIVSMDFAVIAGFAAVLVVVALAAAYFPARRAVRVDPTVALRYE